MTHVRHLDVDLFDAVTLAVGDFFGDELQDAHAEGVDVDLLVVDAVREDLGRHELGGSGDGHLCTFPQPFGETQVADHDLGRLSVDEDVGTLEVAVDDGGISRVEILESLENLDGPPLDCLHRQLLSLDVATFQEERMIHLLSVPLFTICVIIITFSSFGSYQEE